MGIFLYGGVGGGRGDISSLPMPWVLGAPEQPHMLAGP